MAHRGFSVIDTETTGIFAGGTDRIIEIAVVQVDPDGRRSAEWSTLLNPHRDLGRTDIHGITGAQVRQAPEFADISDELCELLDNRIVVGHNVSFDARFLAAEWFRAGVLADTTFPAKTMCTMRIAHDFSRAPSRKLGDCCAEFGISLADAHSALGDARATADLLSFYLATGGAKVGKYLPPHPFSARALARLDKRGQCCPRSERPSSITPGIHRALGGLEPIETTEAEEEYLAMLDRALEDQLLSMVESAQLGQFAVSHGITPERMADLHEIYFQVVAASAWEDQQLTLMEREQLTNLARILALPHSLLKAALKKPEVITPRPAAANETPQAPSVPDGAAMVLTGHMSFPRAHWTKKLTEAGYSVQPRVTKKTDVLVAGDPDSLSNKANKARAYGIPIVSEAWLIERFGLD